MSGYGVLESSAAADAAALAEEQRQVLRVMDCALHDLGQPLTSVALAMELIACEADKAVAQQMLLTARAECARAMRDVDHLRRQTAKLIELTR